MHDLDRTLRTYEPEFGASDNESADEIYQELWGEALQGEGSYSDQELNDLAAELLSVSDEGELDEFFRKLLRRAGGFAKKLAPVIKPLAKKLLPIAGRAVGTYFGGPVGGALGSKLGTLATNLFEVDMEGLEPQEAEMEVARGIVKLATTAAEQAAAAPANADPNQVVRAAMTAAAQQHAPGLLRNRGGRTPSRKTGRWVRQGNRLIVIGL
ncbi:MAG TPA: hypothetical protein VND45_00295 [Thermoanaerobaculia bacterium]|jgi:hypothetical protein|nr:hypothetical protein [Thermoanaerobaculia bacterium]